MYRIFDTTLDCEFPLPELPESSAEDFSFSVKLGNPDLFDASGFETTFEWINYSGECVCWCERRADEYLYVFPRNAHFHVSNDGIISCLLHEDSSVQAMRHLLLNQIIPRYLASTGRLVLHARAVMLENGRSVAFLGNSGLGKSTLASSFHRNGALLISDDCILLNPGEKEVTAIGGFPGIRLFPDSLNAVFHETAGFTHYTPWSDKQQLILKNKAGEVPTEPRALNAIFLLDDPGEIEQGEAVCIEPVTGSAAMMAMIYCAFSLDPSDRQMIARNFRNIGQAISERLGTYSLRYPRVHDRLPEVREAVLGRVDPG